MRDVQTPPIKCWKRLELLPPPRSWLMNHLFECAWLRWRNGHSLIRGTRPQDQWRFHMISPSIRRSCGAKRSCSHTAQAVTKQPRPPTEIMHPVHSPGAVDCRQADGDDHNTRLNYSWPWSSGSAHPTEREINYISAWKLHTLCCACHQKPFFVLFFDRESQE